MRAQLIRFRPCAIIMALVLSIDPATALSQDGSASHPANAIAISIGLNSVDPNHYAGWSGDLQACEADAQDMAAIASSRGFRVTTLLTKHATRQAILDGIRAAAGTLQSGDIFMISYSGHGGQVPDQNGDELDNEDETWCAYDGEIIDDELAALWAQFRTGVRILAFSDSCHSGTVVRVKEYAEYLDVAPINHADRQSLRLKFDALITPDLHAGTTNVASPIRAMPSHIAAIVSRKMTVVPHGL